MGKRRVISSTEFDYETGKVTDRLTGRTWVDPKLAADKPSRERSPGAKDVRALMPTKVKRDLLRDKARRAAVAKNGGAVRIQGKATNGRGLWLSRSAIARAVDRAGIRWPVTVEWVPAPSMGRATGRHLFTGGAHVILVRDDLDAQEARVTLGHELSHCAEQERHATRAAFRASYAKAKGRFEADAERGGRRIAVRHPGIVGSR
jgi:hypothetical protein